MAKIDVLLRRNKLMVKILWGITIVFILLVSTSEIDNQSLFIIGPSLITLSMVVTFFVKKRIFTEKIMYFIAVSLAFIHFLFVVLFYSLSGFLIAFAMITIIASYQNYKAIIITGCIELTSIIYGYFTGGSTMFGTLYHSLGLTIVIVLFVIIITVMALQSVATEKIRKDVEEQREHAEKNKEKIESILTQLKETIQTLIGFTQKLKDNVSITGKISDEVTIAFNGISESVDTQVNIISDINSMIQKENNDIEEVVSQADEIVFLSNDNLSSSNTIEEQIGSLKQEMDKVNNNVNDTVKSVRELIINAQDIKTILETVDGVSEQINMLSLNASIEAARAGEYGVGFAVVAREISKLAGDTKTSSNDISEKLGTIQTKISDVSKQVSMIHQSTDSNTSNIKELDKVFTDINFNSNTVVGKINNVDEKIRKVKKVSISVCDNVGDINSFSQEIAASTQQVLASVNEQNSSVGSIVESFGVLESLIQDLKELTKDS